MFNPALLIMNPRQMPQCLRAIHALAIDKFFLSYMFESDLEGVIAEIVEKTRYTHFIIVADDCEPEQSVLELVKAGMLIEPDACVTGYCNNVLGSPMVNVTRGPFQTTSHPVKGEHIWYTREELEADRSKPFRRSWFAGFALTGMSRDMWRSFPFWTMKQRIPRGYCSDWSLSIRLQQAGVPIHAVVGAFVQHHASPITYPSKDFDALLEREPERKLLMSERMPEVRWVKKSGADRTVYLKPWSIAPLTEMLEVYS